MAVNDIEIKFVCSECGKITVIKEPGIFDYRGALIHDLNITKPKGWIFIDVMDNTPAFSSTLDSHNFCSYNCISKFFSKFIEKD